MSLDGNYGVSYAIRVGFAAGVKSGVVLSPQGGGWGGAGFTVTGPGGTGTPTLLPSATDDVSSQTDGIVVGAFGAGSTAGLVLLSAGGSSLPVDLVTVPLP